MSALDLETTKSLDNASQLVLRNLRQLKGAQLLVVNYPEDAFLLWLARQRPLLSVVAFNHYYAPYQQLRNAYELVDATPAELVFAPAYAPTAALHDAALVFLPKSKALIEMTLAMVGAALQPGAACFLVGENEAGIRSSRPLLEQYIGPVRMVDAARHCVLFQATHQREIVPFHLEQWLTTYQLTVRGRLLKVVSLPGVFSQGHLDEGTALLLETLDDAPPAHVLDFGCGAGVIGATLKQTWPTATVDMVDSNALALEAAHRTMHANHLPVDQIGPSNVFSDVQGVYTHIISNPPFHTGVKTDYRVVTTFLQEAAQHLTAGGILRIVANRFLKYQPLIEAQIGPCHVVAENRGYRVYEGTRR